jgi:ribosomal protein L11 methyltransferase
LDWLEVTVPAAPDDVEAVADVLRRYSPGGVSIEEPLRSQGDSVAIDPGQPALVKAYLRRDECLPSRRRALRRDLSRLALDVALPRLRGRWVREEDWAESWKRHFQIERVGRRLIVSPRWREYHPRPDEIVIRLDPGMAFGTGQHPTTRMCLLALERHLLAGCRLLDLGTGTGILAIAAARLGAGEVIALDTDDLAVAVARDNLAANAVDGRVTVVLGSLGGAWPLSDPYRGAFDRLVANISSAAIVELAPELVSSLKKGGIGIAGGISDRRCGECRQALQEAGAVILQVMSEGDWRTLIFEA